MSDPPEKKHPWFDYYAKRGVSRPPVVRPVMPPPPAATSKENAPRSSARAGVSDELAAAVAAATAESPGTTAAPFITFMQRDAVARELRREARLRWIWRSVAGLAALVVVHFAITRFFYRAPTESALQTYAAGLSRALLPLYSTSRQPLQFGDVTVTLTDHVSSSRIRYTAEVILRLQQPLYVPALTNGTAVYRQMQQSLWAARELDLRLKLFEGKAGPSVPAMPLLIQVAHRAGEKIVVRVPFQARRFGWNWRIEAAPLALRWADRAFDGSAIETYARTPHLVFGAPGTLADIRQRTQLARAYVIAVAKEVQKQADVEAVTGAAAPDPALANLPALDISSPASEELADKPAMPAPAIAPAIDPNAPAIDPNQPAVPDQKPPARPDSPALLDRSHR